MTAAVVTWHHNRICPLRNDLPYLIDCNLLVHNVYSIYPRLYMDYGMEAGDIIPGANFIKLFTYGI